MKHSSTPLFYILLFLLVLCGCEPTLTPPTPTKGALDFSKVVAIGSATTAGMSNSKIWEENAQNEYLHGGMYENAQTFSYPQILANQLTHVSDIEFKQPLMAGAGTGYLQLEAILRTPCDLPSMALQIPDPDWEQSVASEGPFHNWGLPGLKMRDINVGSLGNAYFDRMVTTPEESYLDRLKAAQPSFFSIWLGMEDVLPAAYLGGRVPNNSIYSMTEVDDYRQKLDMLLETLMAQSDAKGVILTIPDITALPFFSAIKQFARDSSCQPISLFMRESNGETRTMGEDDFPLLTRWYEVIGPRQEGFSELNPLLGKYVLDREEVSTLRQRIADYNAAIVEAAASYNQTEKRIAVVDMHSFFQKIAGGMVYSGIQINAQYLTGNFVSLDGLFPTGRGNALIANEIINTLNDFFEGVNIPPADVTRFPGVAFP